MKKHLILALTSFMLLAPAISSCGEVSPNTSIKPGEDNVFKYSAVFNLKGKENDPTLTNEILSAGLKETYPIIKNATFNNCYIANNGGVKFSSKTKLGSMKFVFKQNITIENINLKASKFLSQESKVQIKIGSYLKEITPIKVGENIIHTGTQIVDSFEISALTNSFILNGFDINQAKIKPTPDAPDGNVIIEENPNGIIQVSKMEGLIDESIKITVTPNDNYYVSAVKVNGKLIQKTNDEYIFKLVAGENKVTVEFKEKSNSPYSDLFESEEVMNFGTRGSAGSVDDYYAPVKGLTGVALKNKLNEIIRDKVLGTYNELKQSFIYTDINPDNPRYLNLMYTGEQRLIPNGATSLKLGSSQGELNREHVWPDSMGVGKEGAGCDKHMQRICEAKINNARQSFPFGYVTGNDDLINNIPMNAGNKVGGGKFEPKDEFKGDVARIIFYMATCYDNLELASPSDKSRFNDFKGEHRHGVFDDLYEWATDPSIDPVSKFEMNKNNVVDMKYQHNRNPFIDHPEFIEMIYDKNYDGPGALE